MRLNIALLSTIIACATMLCAISAPAAAQSDAQLRRQNDELRQRVQNLTDELRAANQRIKELEASMNELKAQLATAGRNKPDEPAPDQPVSIDESKPDASPRALLAHLQADYQKTLGDMDPGSTGDRQRMAYVRDLNRWVKSVNRQLRSQIEWWVRIEDAKRSSRGMVLQVVAIDPKTKTQLGDSFIASLENTAVIRRLERMERRGSIDELVLRGILEPRVTVNERRSERGTFNTPPFIGPFAEFGFVVVVETLLSPDELKTDDGKKDDGKKAGGG